jgi:hypothetical protein
MGTMFGPFPQRFRRIALERDLIQGVHLGQMLCELLDGLTLALYLKSYQVISIRLGFDRSVIATYPCINPRNCQIVSPLFIGTHSGQPKLATISDIAIITG